LAKVASLPIERKPVKIEPFELERLLSIWQNQVEYYITDSGVDALYMHEFVTEGELLDMYRTLPLRYVQTDGPRPLKEAICQLYEGASPENVFVTNGTSEANFIILWRFIQPGDEVAVAYPNYLHASGLAATLGAKVNVFHRREADRWAPDLDELEAQVTRQTRLIYVCNPHNPTGAILSQEEMRHIVRIAQEVGAWILADEVYRGAELVGDITPSFWGLYDKVLVTAGMSKAFALPGLRLGWIVGPPQTVGEIWPYHDYTTITTNALSQHLAQLALRPETRSSIQQRIRQISDGNLKTLTSWVEKHSDVLRLVPPKICGVSFVGYDLPINSTDLIMQLIHHESVLVAPGDVFGMDGYFRVGYGSSRLQPGLKRISERLESIGA
jgi:aspartate/methionine/tyrosine aminotransferase